MSIVPEEGSILSNGTNANNDLGDRNVEEYNPETGNTIRKVFQNLNQEYYLLNVMCYLDHLIVTLHFTDCEPDYDGQVSPTSKLRARITQTLSNIQGVVANIIFKYII